MTAQPQRTRGGPPPWYRQFWPWFLIALPASAVAASLVTIWLATREPPAMVVDDYARIGQVTHRKLERDHRAAELGLEAELALGPQAVELRLRGLPADRLPASLSLLFSHPTLARFDARVELIRRGAGYRGPRPALGPGRWYVQVEPPGGDWRLAGVLGPGQQVLALAPRPEG